MPFKNPHPLYHVWHGMHQRCKNANSKQWKDYGGRGISVCERWNDFHVFLHDMGPRPDGWSLDRIDNSIGYTPANCRWASRREQQMNRRNTVFVTIEGVRHKAGDLAKISGIKTDTIIARATKGLSYAEIIDPAPRRDISGFALGGKANGAKHRAKTHCSNGHEFTAENTYVTKEGWRNCRKCRTKEGRTLGN